MDPESPHKAVLQPRRPGESIKVAQTVLKRRDRNLKAKAERAAAVAAVRKQRKDFKKGKLKIVRAEKLVKQSRLKKLDRERILRQKRKKKPKKGMGKVVAAVRNGRMGGSKDVFDTLTELGLTRQHSVVFLPNTDETAAKLNVIRPFAFWGPPNFKNICTIMQKKALFRDPNKPKRKTLLSDNALVEEHLGDLGLLCVEDLTHSIFNCTSTFEAVTKRLWPIPLGDAKKANGLVHDKDFTFGNLKGNVNGKLSNLLGAA
eukprot:CAMPEP_0117513250 /NCGR_PEP_ID=MMETSP0784-20121206/29455_1 /TAXON_ID=39447 /ORGANISM="" /LENGTH=258 /DNA_ID=CAMNT_0005309005 /DNA_START=78 /DNA_END=854 /DNA_ORIENTATION=+